MLHLELMSFPYRFEIAVYRLVGPGRYKYLRNDTKDVWAGNQG
jgi:hypothetical protein